MRFLSDGNYMFLKSFFQTRPAQTELELVKRVEILEKEMEILRKINRKLSFSLDLLYGNLENKLPQEQKQAVQQILRAG